MFCIPLTNRKISSVFGRHVLKQIWPLRNASLLFSIRAFPAHGRSLSPLSSKCKNPALLMLCDLCTAWHSKKFLCVLRGHLILMNFAGWKEEGSSPTPQELGDKLCLFISVRSIQLRCKYPLAPKPCDLCIRRSRASCPDSCALPNLTIEKQSLRCGHCDKWNGWGSFSKKKPLF
jgi:hypothetical protein